jgi:ABC-type multidrug transport system fused ATPase/permease subunit
MTAPLLALAIVFLLTTSFFLKMSESAGPRNPTSPDETFRNATASLSQKLKAQETQKFFSHQLYSIIFVLLTIVQLMVGATITALGPLSGKYMVVITILGAVTTVIAGLLAFMEGRGLPQRHRKDLVEIRKVQTYIAGAEIKLKYGDRDRAVRDVDAFIEEARARYERMQNVIDMNHPDSYADGPQLERCNRLEGHRPVADERTPLLRAAAARATGADEEGGLEGR